MPESFFSPKSHFNSVNQYLIICALLLIPVMIFVPTTDVAAINDEITNNFPNKEEFTGFDRQKNQFDDINYFLFGDFDYTANVGAVIFSPREWQMGTPIIRHNSGETLSLQFDDLDADYKNYYYTIIHCDAHWNPTSLMDFEYIDGFNQDQITDYNFSINTIVPYTQYRLIFPNRNMRPMLSGNYLLKVFLDGNPSNIVFTRRFMVLEQRLPVTGSARLANMVTHRDTRHQLDFTIDITPYYVSNPYQDLKIVIQQNGRWDNAITGIAPRMIRGNLLIYDHEEQLLFEGGNEFRRFDTRSLRQISERVQDISTGATFWNIFLLPDQPRPYRRYTTENDINGRFTIQTADASDDNLEADYAWVNFSLQMDNPIRTGTVHLMGELTQWGLSSQNEMVYNTRLRQYELSLLLKQGYYNYWYAFLERGHTAGEVCIFEGCHSQTENEYTVYVYHRPPGSLSDHLVGMAAFNSSVRQR